MKPFELPPGLPTTITINTASLALILWVAASLWVQFGTPQQDQSVALLANLNQMVAEEYLQRDGDRQMVVRMADSNEDIAALLREILIRQEMHIDEEQRNRQ